MVQGGESFEIKEMVGDSFEEQKRKAHEKKVKTIAEEVASIARERKQDFIKAARKLDGAQVLDLNYYKNEALVADDKLFFSKLERIYGSELPVMLVGGAAAEAGITQDVDSASLRELLERDASVQKNVTKI